MILLFVQVIRRRLIFLVGRLYKCHSSIIYLWIWNSMVGNVSFCLGLCELYQEIWYNL